MKLFVGSWEADRGCITLDTDRRNGLLIENISHIMTMKLLRKPLTNRNVTPSIKSLLRQGQHKADNDGMRKEMRPECPQ